MQIYPLSRVRLAVILAAVCMGPVFGFAAPDSKASLGSDQVKASDNAVVSLDFQDADIRNVLKVLAFKSGVNIVAAPDVTGVVTIQLNDVPWQKALDVILSTYGYGFARKGNIITVMTVENLKKYREDTTTLQTQEPLTSRTFALSFARAEDVMKIIDKMKSGRGFINFDPRTNALIIRDLESNLELIAGVIKSLDTITPQILIETKVLETDVDDTDNLGIDWSITATSTGSMASSRNFGTAPTNTFTYGTISSAALTATLENLISTANHTKVLSDPRIVTLDNEKASFVVVDQYPIPNYTFNATTGTQQISGFNYQNIGITFEVTPHVNNAGLITLDLHPQITTLLGTIPLATGSTTTVVNIPEINNQETKTKVMVENGKTLVIAGLISDETKKHMTKVPLLGDLPWLGKLFSSTETEVIRKELLIFMTPRIITIDSGIQAPAAVQ